MTIKKWLLGPIVAVSVLMYGMAMAATPSPTGIDPIYPTVVSNMEVWKLYQDYQMLIEEMDLSVTKNNAGLLSHDADRWKAMINGMKSEVAYWQSQQYLDFAVTHGTKWTVGEALNPPCDFKDNTAICQLMAMIKSARDELVLSASAGIPMHLYPADEARQQTYWTAMLGYLDHLGLNNPIDQPVTAAEENLGLVPGFANEPANP